MYRLFVNTRLHLVPAHYLYNFNYSGFEVTEGYQIPIVIWHWQ